MEKVKVNKGDLHLTLKANREAHAAEYKDAFMEYQRAMIEEMESKIYDISHGQDFSRQFECQRPECHTDSYDIAIDMVEWCVDETIVLSYRDFRRFIHNEWDWKERFEATKSYYASRK